MARYIVVLAQMFLINYAFSQAILFDQTSGATPSGLVAQDFESIFNGNDCRIADDFTVPAGQTWYIDSVRIYGFYNVNNPDTAGMNFTIYNDNSGSIGSQVYAQVFQINLDPDENGSITAVWNTPLQVAAGTYWMAASARKDYLNDQGVWYWYLDSAGSGYEAKWENPGGSWNVCTSWTNITASSCVGVAYPDVVFRIYGCLGPNKPTINNLPADTTFCEGPEITLTASSNSSGVNYAWNTGDSTASITVGAAGLYVVTAYNPTTLCGATSNIYLNIIPAPTSNVADDTICDGQTKNYVSNCSSCQFVWGDGSTSNTFSASTTGWVTVTMTDASTGCVGIDSGWLEIVPLPAIEFLPGNPAHGCIGDTLTLGTANNYDQYYWDHVGWSSIKDTSHIDVVANGEYLLTVTNSLGCLITGSVEVIFHAPPQPNVAISYTNNWKTRLTADAGYQSYLWSNGEDDAIIVVSSTGAYSLTVTDEFGCTGFTSLWVITIPAGVDETEDKTFKVYPNPADEYLMIESMSVLTSGASIQLIDQAGRVIRSENLAQSSSRIDISEVAAGSYLLFIQVDGKGSAKTVIIE